MGTHQSTKFIGLDVHKNSISLAIASNGEDEVRLYGTIRNTLDAMDKVIRKLVSTGEQLRFVYEAGPCGFVLCRHLTKNGFNCVVAAPSMIPRKSGDRIKNDTRDAISLARLLRAGELMLMSWNVKKPAKDQEMGSFVPLDIIRHISRKVKFE